MSPGVTCIRLLVFLFRERRKYNIRMLYKYKTGSVGSLSSEVQKILFSLYLCLFYHNSQHIQVLRIYIDVHFIFNGIEDL